ncbi:27043_t:CDS:2 [Dentiscutata erythropus]|uniref:27043_t:CDS:1 n=1 Tax=Dentiscutata erythropus TaxID=1348616 RepID=A0A9N9ISN9_9GLOM|nr:27043_t:CDS:2 [Dentiscutata erythropus]
MQDYNEIDTKALIYAKRCEGQCLAKVRSNPNIYLWVYKNQHRWEASYRDMKRNYRWCNSCPYIFERSCRYIFEELLHKKFPPRKPKFLEGLQLDGYNEELYLAFEYSSNQHYQIVPFFHPQGQINLDARIQRDWEKRALCLKKAGSAKIFSPSNDFFTASLGDMCINFVEESLYLSLLM